MINKFIKYTKEEGLITSEDKLLLACSGGVDSMALFHLLRLAEFNFEVAHCNFQLRGEASDADESHVRKICKEHNIVLHSTSFSTKEESKKLNKGTQETARKLRYDWLYELKEKLGLDKILTAHHQDDLIETYLFHVLRGNHWSGFSSIPHINDSVFRPILWSSKEELLNFCQESEFEFRIDGSNDTLDYSRNKIRHQLIPLMNEIRPGFKSNILRQIDMFREVEYLMEDYMTQVDAALLQPSEDGIVIYIKDLSAMPYPRIWMMNLASEYGFNTKQVDDILHLALSDSGKMIQSKTHRIIRNRDHLLINKTVEPDTNEYLIESMDGEITTPINVLITEIENKSDVHFTDDLSIAYLDERLLTFPLKIRRWKKGDRFKPLGMNQYQKLSDFFVQQKMSLVEKQKVWILESGDEIAWIIGRRISDTFKITDDSMILKLEWIRD